MKGNSRAGEQGVTSEQVKEQAHLSGPFTNTGEETERQVW